MSTRQWRRNHRCRQAAPKGAQVLVRVRALRPQPRRRHDQGHAHGGPAAPARLGMEWAGEVAELWPRREGRQGRRQIMGSVVLLSRNTRWRSRPAVSHAVNMNFEDAATLPVALTTMHNAVVTNGALLPGQSVLIQGRVPASA